MSARPLGRNSFAASTYPRSSTAAFASQALAASLVVDPTLPQGGNIFPTLEAAAAARKQLAGPAVIALNGSITTTAAVIDLTDANGNWNTSLYSPLSNGATVLTVPAVTTDLDGISDIYDITVIKTGGAGALMKPPTNVIMRLHGGAQLNSDGAGTGPVLRALTGRFIDTVIQDFANIVSSGGAGPTVDAVGVGAILALVYFDNGSTDTNSIAQSGGGTTVVVADSTATNVVTTQSGMPGGIIGLGAGVLVGSFVGSPGATRLSTIKGPGGALPAVQAGTGALLNGTATVSAILTNNSRIGVSYKDSSGTAINNKLQAPAAGRNVGAHTFVVQAFNAAVGAVDATDTSTFDWWVFN